MVGITLHLDQIDNAGKQFAASDGQLDRNRVGPQPVLNHGYDVVKISPGPIHLVHERHPGNMVLVCLPPDRFGLGLNSPNRTKNGHRPVENPKASFYFNGKVNVARCVDDVDAMVFPETGRGSRGDRYPTFPFLLHPVHSGRAIMYLAHTVQSAGIEQDPFGDRGLTGIDVRHDADISNLF